MWDVAWSDKKTSQMNMSVTFFTPAAVRSGYEITENQDGIGFSVAFKMAESQGAEKQDPSNEFSINDPRRIVRTLRSCLLFLLSTHNTITWSFVCSLSTEISCR